MKRVDLNVDIGEGFPYDEALLEFATSANVCCGVHAGSPGLTFNTAKLCAEKGVRVGAHPGFPDRESMGRRTPTLDELAGYASSLLEQPQYVPGYQYIKPHGAFYNILVGRSSDEEGLRTKAWEIAIDYYERNKPLMLLDGENLTIATRNHFPDNTHPLIKEGFADRSYRPDGSLVPRSESGAVLHDPEAIRRQVLELAPRVDSICLHGDTPNCLEFAEMVYRTLTDAGYEVGH